MEEPDAHGLAEFGAQVRFAHMKCIGNTVDTVVVIAVMLCAILVSFGLGYAIRYLVRPPYRKYIPFLVSIYEGGMIGYPLYTSLCGVENLSHIALLDVACLLFGFGVYMGLLQQAETGQRAKIKELALSALKNPTFIATVLGIAAGATGLLQWLLDSGAGGLYLAVQNIITVGMSALILLVVGYDLDFSLGLVLPCLKAIAFRIVVQSALAAAVIAVFHALFGENVLLSLAVIMLMASPCSVFDAVISADRGRKSFCLYIQFAVLYRYSDRLHYNCLSDLKNLASAIE